ncbi:unnamed protein product [Spodoptera exigua]|nr:unnamed protein product [Spodoptera exigua]
MVLFNSLFSKARCFIAPCASDNSFFRISISFLSSLSCSCRLHSSSDMHGKLLVVPSSIELSELILESSNLLLFVIEGDCDRRVFFRNVILLRKSIFNDEKVTCA